MSNIKNQEELFQCPVCELYYKDSDIRDACEAWCTEQNSCNLELIQHAVTPEKTSHA